MFALCVLSYVRTYVLRLSVPLYRLQVLVCWSGVPFVYCFSFLFTSNLLAFLLAVAMFYFVPTVSGIVCVHVGGGVGVGGHGCGCGCVGVRVGGVIVCVRK